MLNDENKIIDKDANGKMLGIQEVSEITGISAFTIRYYDKCGFFPNLKRGKRGVRSFSQSDIQQLTLVDSLRKSGLSIEGIGYYVRLCNKGDETRQDRLSILQIQTTALEYQIAEAENSLAFLRSAQSQLKEKSGSA